MATADDVNKSKLEEYCTTQVVRCPKPLSEAIPQRRDFNSLPADLKASIIEQLIRPTDLKSVCLASKELHEIAVRFLYNKVSLDLGYHGDNKLSAFLNPRNKGLVHIRQIRLYLAKIPTCCANQETQASFATRMMLEFLPEDILEEFSWCPWVAFGADNLLLLYKKQRKLRWGEVMDLDRSVLNEMFVDKSAARYQPLFKYMSKLALYPENRATLEMAGQYIAKTADKLDEMIVHANFGDDSPSSAEDTLGPAELNDSATRPGLITASMFKHLLPFDTCQPLSKLTSLRLHRINLRFAVDTWCKVINFKQCKSLRLYHCLGADSLLSQLSKASNLPTKLRVFELQHKDNSENEALLALDGFLCLVAGVRDLIIDMQNVKSMPATAGIVRQSNSLELLNVHASAEGSSSMQSGDNTDAEELIYSTDDFEKICKACTKLEQVSCAWPARSVIRAPSDEWKKFEHAVVDNLKMIVTLHITSWPNNKPSGQLLPRQVYDQLMQGVAQRLFELARTDKSGGGLEPESVCRLRLIAFGISDRIYEREDSKNQLLYLRSTAIDAEGRHKVHAAPIGWCLRQFVEPRSEILEFMLGRDSRPPVRGDGRDAFSMEDIE